MLHGKATKTLYFEHTDRLNPLYTQTQTHKLHISDIIDRQEILLGGHARHIHHNVEH